MLDESKVITRGQDMILDMASALRVKLKNVEVKYKNKRLDWVAYITEPNARLARIGGYIDFGKDTDDEEYRTILKRNVAFMLSASMMDEGVAIVQAVSAYPYCPDNLAVATFVHACVSEYQSQIMQPNNNDGNFRLWSVDKMINYFVAKLKQDAYPRVREIRKKLKV
jgi:hypothetical protein